MNKEIHLLIIEDSVDDAELLVFELEKSGFILSWERADSKPTLESALNSKSWDLVISDFAMPGFNGVEALEIVRQFDSVLPFILVSGAIGEKYAVELMKRGAQDYILKNNLLRLSSAVSRVLVESQARRKALKDESDLKESNKMLSMIYNSTSESMCLLKITENEFVIQSVNDAFLRGHQELFGPVTRKELKGQGLIEFSEKMLLFDQKQKDLIFDHFRNAVKTKTSTSFIEQLVIGDRTIYEEVLLNPIIDNEACTFLLLVAKNVTQSILSSRKLEKAYNNVAHLKTQLEHENLYLKEEINLSHNFDEIIYLSDSIKNVLQKVEQVAPVDVTVLVTGETGTGKELMVRAIHKLSQRKDQPFIKVNCAALPRDLIESELFGHEKGAFTGALNTKLGRFELANNGTIFLDEIGELPIELQSKLLRVLQEGEFDRLGGSRSTKVDVRVIAATNKDLIEEINKGAFREDLYYRINVFPIVVPPLRERREDILPLLSYFIRKYQKKFNKPDVQISNSSVDVLRKYQWPGNVRELENLVERALIVFQNGKIHFKPFLSMTESHETNKRGNSVSLKEIERSHIIKILDTCNWKINGQGGAAELLELTPSTLRDRMKKYKITRPDP